MFAILATFFGLASLFLMPLLNAPDENQHFQVEYAIFSSNKKVPESLVLNEQIVLSAVQNENYSHFFNINPDVKKDGVSINIGSLVFDGKTRASVFDVMRLPQALGVLTGRLIHPSIGVMVITGRLFALILYIVSLYFIIKKVHYGKWVFMTIASLPIMIHQAASLSYDPINLLAIFAWVAFIINLSIQKTVITRNQLLIGALLILFLLVTKSNNLFLLLFIFTLPLSIIAKSTLYQRVYSSKHRRALLTLLSAFLAAIACAGVYLLAAKLLAGQEFQPRRLADVLLNTFFWGNLTLIDVTAVGVIGYFGNFYYHLPVWTIIITFVLLIIIMASEKIPAVSKRMAVISSLLFVGSILLISVGMYYGWAMKPERLGILADVTDGIQGRYFTPLLILLFPAVAYIRQYIGVSATRPIPVYVLCITLTTLLLTLYLVQTWRFFWI